MSGKFRDKETGVEGYLRANREIEYQIEDERGIPINDSFKTLSELLEKWEEIEEEPKGVKDIYFVGASVYIEMHNKKEAIEVEEKLKAWKRLKDKGFRFLCWNVDYTIDFTINGQNTDNKIKEYDKDLDLLFGGENE